MGEKVVKPEEKAVKEKVKKPVEKLEETEVTLNLAKDLENEFVDISVINVVSDSIEASLRLAKQQKVEKPKEEIVGEKVAKPEEKAVKEKVKKPVEKLEETEVTLNLAKDLENEFVDISVINVVSDSIEASLRLAKQQKVEKPKEEIVGEKVAKPEEKAVKEKVKKPVEKLEETEVTLNLAKDLENEFVDISVINVVSDSIEASLRLAKQQKVEKPKEEIVGEKVAKPEEKAVKEKVKKPVEKLEETEVTLNLAKDLENEFVDISVITVVSDSIEASLRLAKQQKVEKPKEETAEEKVAKPEEKATLEETEITLDLGKSLENEGVGSIEASVRLAKQQKVEKPKEDEEKVVKPEEKAVKEKVKKPVEKLEETEVTLNLAKDLENEFVDISVITVVSDSIEASLRLAKQQKVEKPKEETAEEKVAKPEEKAVKKKAKKPVSVETLEETEITLDLGKSLENEGVGSIEASVRLAKQQKVEKPKEDEEKVVKPEEKAVKEKAKKPVEKLEETEVTLNLAKDLENEFVDISVINVVSDSIEASLRLAKQQKVEKPKEEIVGEKVAKPEEKAVKEKVKKPVEKLEETEVTLNLAKDLENEFVDISVINVVSDSIEASLRLAKQQKVEKPKEEIVGEKVAKPEEKAVKKKAKKPVSVETLEETEITLDLGKSLENEGVGSIEASVRLAKQQKVEKPKEDEEKVVKPEEKAVKEKAKKPVEKLEETEVTLNLAKDLENEFVDISVINVVSDSIEASLRLAKQQKVEKPKEEIVGEKVAKPEEKAVKEKVKKPVEKLEETEVTLNLAKDLENEFVDISVITAVSDSIEASLRLAKQQKVEKPKEETAEEKVAKPEEKAVKKKAKKPVSVETLEETEITLDLGKSLENEGVDSIEASVRLAKEPRVEMPKEETAEEKVVKPGKKAVKEKVKEPVEKLEETEVTLNLVKDLENEFVDISVITVVSDSIEASVRLAKEPRVEKPKEEIIEEEMVKRKGKTAKKKTKKSIEKLETGSTVGLEKDSEHGFVDISIISAISDSIQALVQLTKRTEKRKDETVDGKNLSAAESWYAINESGPETEFDVHLPAMNAFLCNDATVSLCVEKPAENGFVDAIPTSAGFCCCSLSVYLPELRKTARGMKEKMERPAELSMIRGKHSEEIPVETVSISFEFTKQRTQKIGVGTIFNSERPTEQIELAEEIIRPSPHNEAVKLLPLREKCSACLSFCIGKKTKNEDTVDIDVTVIPETERERSKERSRSVIADIEVDAGEEMATTDAIVDVLTSFEESELAITEFLSDILDVDVTLDALMEEEFIEAIGPAFHSQLASLVVQMPTVVTAISQLIEEVKLLAANAETEILMPVANKTEMQQLTLTLQKADYESHENFRKERKAKSRSGEEKKESTKALVIPAEISTKYGDKSTLLSETTMTTEIAMNEVMAEVEISPKKSLSASVAMKVDSAKRRKSVSHRSSSAEKFTFKDIEEGTELKIAEENVRKTKKRTGLPPVPKTKEEIEVDKESEEKDRRAGKDLEEQKQGKKSIDELGKIETVKLTPITKEIEKQETYERARKKRIGFIQAPDKEVIAFRGDTIKIECELLNEDDFMWLINDKPASEDLRCIEEVNSLIRTLTIRNIVPEDEETIIVAKVGDIVAETIIHVEDTPAEIIEPLPRRSFGKCGENVTLAVSVTHPAHSIVWEFNGEKLPQDDGNYMIAEEGNIYTLTIKDATYNDAGRYSIKVDSLETSTTLVMQGAPIIEKPERKVLISETHENLLLSILIKAVPEPTIDCFFNNEPLLVGTKLKLEIINDMVQFCKRKINKNDSGEYTFKISNEFGEAVKTFTVNVKGK
uniref:Ig-like domain-containing protein n=1 Tax=Loa loa TaxID=7209 RepID=A0A1I7VR26_LOALO